MEEQSPFVSAQEQLQPPPEAIKTSVTESKPPKSKRLWVMITVIGFLLFLMVVLLAAVLQQNRNGEVEVTPTPTMAPPPTSSPKESALQKLKVIVDRADPESNPFPPPQVDMEVEF